ncbi:uncharacterized protein [Coffea arabica]|uniref:Uncharacterized protein isoform X2 n=1 Tax=Coffea arabica TaxID=13443 RepID=A0A6P6VNZ2_COFAR|nr:uncharacterized protein LOC113724940 isoform X2 [Coffea arabica]
MSASLLVYHPSSVNRIPNSTLVRARVRVGVVKVRKQVFTFNPISSFVDSLAGRSPSNNRWRIFCLRHEGSPSEFFKPEAGEQNFSQEVPAFDQPNNVNGISDLRKARDAFFRAEPWVVPWTAKTVIQVMLLWVSSFWLVGSWIVPFLAYALGFRKESLTYRGQALYSLLTDVAEGLTGIAILHRCLARFHPLSSDWFRFSFRGKWQIDVGLGCLMFPLVNQLSQVNLNLFPLLPSSPVTVSNVEQSIVARDPIAMTLYAIVVAVCAPIWEEVVFRGFLLPSLTKYMPVWSSILVSSVAFALAHFNVQRMLPLIFLGIVMGVVFARTRNLFASILLHSLWNAFVFLDLLK